MAKSLAQYESEYSQRNDAISAAYSSGAFTLKDLGAHFDLHYSRVSRIVADPNVCALFTGNSHGDAAKPVFLSIWAK